MADKCDSIRSRLHELEAQLKKIRKWDPDGPRGKPFVDPAWTEKDAEVRRAREDLNACESPLLAGTSTQSSSESEGGER
jgi:hypothetical protein